MADGEKLTQEQEDAHSLLCSVEYLKSARATGQMRDTHRKGKGRTSLFSDDRILYIKELHRETRTSCNTLSKVAGYKMNTQESVGFESTDDRWRKKSTLLTRASENILGQL